MSETQVIRPRLAHVLEGFPPQLASQSAQDVLAQFCLGLDVLGRIDSQSGAPLVDRTSLTAFLRDFLDHDLVDRLVAQLGSLTDSAFRVELDPGRFSEVSWFELARDVVIFDSEPEATIGQLRVASTATIDEVVRSVRTRFPSMEAEMLDPAVLAPQVIRRLEDPADAAAVLQIIARQLGWWAALVAVLMLPPAVVATRSGTAGDRAEIVWPLAMNLLAAGVGGWTLTVVGSCLLAPLPSSAEGRQ